MKITHIELMRLVKLLKRNLQLSWAMTKLTDVTKVLTTVEIPLKGAT